MLTFITVVIGIGVYLLPTIVASRRNLQATGKIAAINIFLGWTILGWIVALALAVKESAVRVRIHRSGWSNAPVFPTFGTGGPFRSSADQSLCEVCQRTIFEEHSCSNANGYQGD